MPRGISSEVRVASGSSPARLVCRRLRKQSDGSPASLGPPDRIGGAAVLENRRAGGRPRGAAARAPAPRVGRDRRASALSRRLRRHARRHVSRHRRRLHARGRLLRGAAGRRGARHPRRLSGPLRSPRPLRRSTTSTIPTTPRRFAFLARAALEFAGRARGRAVDRPCARLAGRSRAGLSADRSTRRIRCWAARRASSPSTTSPTRESSSRTGCRVSISAGISSRSIGSSSTDASAF